MKVSIGIDIGGTKCALSVGECSADAVKILHREEFPTKGMTWREVLEEFGKRMDGFFLLRRARRSRPTGPPISGLAAGGRWIRRRASS